MLEQLHQTSENILISVAGILSIFATVITCLCYLPGAIKTLRTNDTRGISLLMFLISTFGCGVWVIISILLFIGNGDPTNIGPAINTALGMLISNFCLGTFASIILYKKLANVIRAKKLGMTEEKYVSKNLKGKK